MVLSGGSALAAATGQNPNAFFATPTIKKPVISSAANLNAVVLKPTFLYDLPTTAGQTYLLLKK